MRALIFTVFLVATLSLLHTCGKSKTSESSPFRHVTHDDRLPSGWDGLSDWQGSDFDIE